LTPGTFAFNELTNRIGEIPDLLSNIFSFIVVIIAIEVVLRIFYTMYEFWKSEEDADDEDVPIPSEK